VRRLAGWRLVKIGLAHAADGGSWLGLVRRIARQYSSGARKRLLVKAGIGGFDRPLA